MATTLYNPAINSDPLASGWLTYAQLPSVPDYLSPPSLSATSVFTPIPSLLSTATADESGITLDTNGLVFNGIQGYNPVLYFASNGQILQPTSETFSANANTGYAGFTNYTIDFESLDINNIEGSLRLEPVNTAFPALDLSQGFTVAFDLAILSESSAANRAGFSVLVVSSDQTREIELGFKTSGADRVFAQSANFTEAEDSSAVALDFSQTQTYWLSVQGETYSLAANGVQILSGDLRNYNFNPATSDPPLPTAANPYEIANLVFFGDNTDQAYSEFTLGKTAVLSRQTDLNPDTYDDYLASYSDLIAAFGYDVFKAKEHFEAYGWDEGRAVDLFDEKAYLASYDDLINAFGYDLDRATQHYIEYGKNEGRKVTFQADDYLASHGDLIQAFGYDLDAAAKHYIEFGKTENRALDTFDEVTYLNKYADLRAAFGNDLVAATRHFIEYGYAEGRTA